MRIALFSDVHANLPAMEACLKSIDEQNVDAIYCLGDLVGYNVWPNEVINLVKKRGIPTIAGNYDEGIGKETGECGCAYKTAKDQDNGKISIAVTNQLVGDQERRYLRTLPAHIRVDFLLNNDHLSLLLVHGSPRKNNEYLFEDREEKSLLRILEDAEADILCFGHTHKPYHRVIGSKEHYRHAINIGSVGKPKDNDPRGCYVILTIDEHTNHTDKDSLKVEFIRFVYDVEKAAKAVEESELPNEFADMLRGGY
jgi:putative phosphoesterase